VNSPVPYNPSAVVQGSVVNPTAIIDAGHEVVHEIADVFRSLVQRAGAFHNESELDKALTAIGKWEQKMIPANVMTTLAQEHSMLAPKEDVTKRVPPSTQQTLQQLIPQGIDYDRLQQVIAATVQAAIQAHDAERDAQAAVVTPVNNPEQGQHAQVYDPLGQRTGGAAPVAQTYNVPVNVPQR
jgi:hypothetical protein